MIMKKAREPAKIQGLKPANIPRLKPAKKQGLNPYRL
jgi:hypothetical protein